MGFLDNSTVTVDAILTKKGREILSRGGNFNITKFALSDEEIDYTLYDVTHPNGTDSYGAVIENMSLLEAAPNRTDFNSFLTNSSLAGVKLQIDNLLRSNVEAGAPIAIAVKTQGVSEKYDYTIENTNIVKFSGENATTSNVLKEASGNIMLEAQRFATPSPSATTIVRVKGTTTGAENQITISVKVDPSSDNDALAPSVG